MGINVEEYVSEILALHEPGDDPISARDLAEAIADIAMAQGHFEGRDFQSVVDELKPQVEYYL